METQCLYSSGIEQNISLFLALSFNIPIALFDESKEMFTNLQALSEQNITDIYLSSYLVALILLVFKITCF